MFALYRHLLFMKPGVGGGFMKWRGVLPNHVVLAFSLFPGGKFVENQKLIQNVVSKFSL